MSLSSRIKALMEREGIKTIKELAALVDTSDSTLSRIIAQGQSPRVETLIPIAKYFGVTLDWLMRGVGPQHIDYSRDGGVYQSIQMSGDNETLTSNINSPVSMRVNEPVSIYHVRVEKIKNIIKKLENINKDDLDKIDNIIDVFVKSKD